jgi:hypothetical protein
MTCSSAISPAELSLCDDLSLCQGSRRARDCVHTHTHTWFRACVCVCLSAISPAEYFLCHDLSLSLQAQNTRLLAKLAERDEAHSQLLAERVKMLQVCVRARVCVCVQAQMPCVFVWVCAGSPALAALPCTTLSSIGPPCVTLPSPHLLTTFSPPSHHLLSTSSPPSHHLLTTSCPPSPHLLPTFSPPSEPAGARAAAGGRAGQGRRGRALRPRRAGRARGTGRAREGGRATGAGE